MGERENRDGGVATRSHSVIHLMERSHEAAARILSASLDRPTPPSGGPGSIVIVPNADDALGLSAAWAGLHPDGPVLSPVTSVARGRRLVSGSPMTMVGAPDALLALIHESLLRLAVVDSVVLVWPEELLGDDALASLETVLAEAPREAERVALVAERSAAFDAFQNRALWRARIVDHLPPAVPGLSIRFLAATPSQRLPALRTVLDALDPPTVALVTDSDHGEAAARAAAAALGAGAGDETLVVTRGALDRPVSLVVLFEDLPPAGCLTQLAEQGSEVVAIIPPSRVAPLRRLVGTGAQPLTWSGAMAAARAAQDRLRDSLRAVVGSGGHRPWVPVIEPLLADLDAVEVAAAAVALQARERRAVAPAAPQPPENAASRGKDVPIVAGSAGVVRLFLGIGERDGVRRGDLVGAITGECGVTGAQIGRITLRDTHSVVEVERLIAARVIERLNGVVIRGRPVVVREDRGPGAAEPREGSGPRGGARGRPGRPPVSGARGMGRGRERDGARGEGRREDRPVPRGRSRESKPERMPRAATEGREWQDRADRLRNARRGSRSDDE